MPHRFRLPKSGGNKCVCMSTIDISATTRLTCARTSSVRRSGSFGVLSAADKRLSFIMRIGPAVVWYEWRPSGARGILIVRVVAEFTIQLRVLRELRAIEAHAEAGTVGYANRALDVLQ